MRNVIIIGSGPAGLSAPMYAARANLKPLAPDGLNVDHQPAGEPLITTEVQQYPGSHEAIPRAKLTHRLPP